MQTIIGAGGAIGVELAKALTEYTKDIRLVGRNPKKVNETDTLFKADVLNAEELDKAIAGSEVVYVTVGFQYKLSVWQKSWPLFMTNLISSCKKHKAKLVFFDNIYMYDANHLNGMTEETPVNPPSKKGKIRAQIAQMILDEVAAGNLTALIARAADFYGPNIAQNSVLNEVVFKPLSQGKKANWLGGLNFKHSYTFTPDAGKATAILGNTPDAFGQVWHLPTAANPFTGREWVEAVAKDLKVKPGIMPANKIMLQLISLFDPIMKEVAEMYYQNDRDYVFDSSKFNTRFNFTPTPYLEGIEQVIASDYPEKVQ